jgi:pimeloyl-ACP methyl ester carboxylesterase
MQGVRSRWVDLDGPVHYLDFGGPRHGPVLVAVHGLGGSHANWLALGPLLAPTCRVLAPDLPGFGLTRAHGRPTTIAAHGALLRRFVAEVAGAPAIWLGNSMGALITVLAAAGHPDLVAGAVLIDPALLPRPRHRPDPLVTALFAAYFTPGLGAAAVAVRRRVRSPEQLAMDSLELCSVDVRRIPGEVVAAHRELGRQRADFPDVPRDFVAAARSMLPVLIRRRRMALLIGRIGVPVLLLHGERDRLVPVGASIELAAANPGWRFAVARDVGHLPQLEVPDWTATQVLTWLDGAGVAAADAARTAAGAGPGAGAARFTPPVPPDVYAQRSDNH